MESKIPLPTDNIYKFYALFGLLLVVFTVGATLYVNQTTNDLLVGKLVELESLRLEKVLSAREQLQIAIVERQIEVAKANKTFFLRALGLIGAIGTICIVYGFSKWHTEVQPLNDESARVQLELAKLHLAKLKAEVQRTDALHVPPDPPDASSK